LIEAMMLEIGSMMSPPTLYAAKVSGIICISPDAPLAFMALGSPPLSQFIRAVRAEIASGEASIPMPLSAATIQSCSELPVGGPP
jgi:hypothetical protein